MRGGPCQLLVTVQWDPGVPRGVLVLRLDRQPKWYLIAISLPTRSEVSAINRTLRGPGGMKPRERIETEQLVLAKLNGRGWLFP